MIMRSPRFQVSFYAFFPKHIISFAYYLKQPWKRTTRFPSFQVSFYTFFLKHKISFAYYSKQPWKRTAGSPSFRFHFMLTFRRIKFYFNWKRAARLPNFKLKSHKKKQKIIIFIDSISQLHRVEVFNRIILNCCL